MRDAVGKRVGLARARTRDHKQWRTSGSIRPDAVLDGAPLLRIKGIQICVFAVCEHESPPKTLTDIAPVGRNRLGREAIEFD
jgi:hypothetical protein